MSPEGDKGKPQKKGGGALKWLAVGCLLVLLAGGGCVVGCLMIGRGALTNNQAYKMALDKVGKHQEVIDKLGTDLTLNAFIPTGNINVQNNSGAADLSIPVKGSKGTGVISVQATMTNGQWTIDTLTVTVDATGEVITVVGGAEAPAEKQNP